MPSSVPGTQCLLNRCLRFFHALNFTPLSDYVFQILGHSSLSIRSSIKIGIVPWLPHQGFSEYGLERLYKTIFLTQNLNLSQFFLASLKHVMIVWSSFSLNVMILTFLFHRSSWECNRSIEVKSPLYRKMHIHMEQHTSSPWSQDPWFPEVFPCTPDGELHSMPNIFFFFFLLQKTQILFEIHEFQVVMELDKSSFTIANITKGKLWINSISQAMCEYWFQPCHLAFCTLSEETILPAFQGKAHLPQW